jgi:hypothetical protein
MYWSVIPTALANYDYNGSALLFFEHVADLILRQKRLSLIKGDALYRRETFHYFICTC